MAAKFLGGHDVVYIVSQWSFLVISDGIAGYWVTSALK